MKLLGLVLVTVSLLSSLAQAANLDDYYGPDFLNSTPSKEILYKLMVNSKPKSISYDKVRTTMFTKIYLEKDAQRGYFIRDIYCERDLFKEDLGGMVGPNQVPNHTIMNIEHTWPQSRFSNQFPKDIQKTDLHHLFPSNSAANSKRGNLMFAEVHVTSNVKDCEASNLGSAKLQIDGKSYFEPAPEHRGNVARALFYFSVRYKSVITPTEEYYLRKWHDEDPVDEEERTRHEMIVEIENVRNPFIDFPHIVEKIDNF